MTFLLLQCKNRFKVGEIQKQKMGAQVNPYLFLWLQKTNSVKLPYIIKQTMSGTRDRNENRISYSVNQAKDEDFK